MIAVLFGNLFSKTAMKNKGTFFQIFFHLKIDFSWNEWLIDNLYEIDLSKQWID
jgi:hypothetical protein